MAAEEAKRAYQAGDTALALQKLRNALAAPGGASGELLLMLGSICLKRGDKLEAAEAFARAANYVPGNAAQLLKLAVGLFKDCDQPGVVMDLGAKAVALNPADPAFAFLVCQTFSDADQVDRITAMLPALDRADNRHMALVLTCHRANGRYGEAVAEIDAALALRPHDPYLLNQRFEMARRASEIPVIDRFMAMMANPDDPVVAAMMATEKAFGRLIWSDDEGINARPSHDSANFARDRIDPAVLPQRRAIAPAGRPLKIGYLSFDFFNHATMTLMIDALCHHDTEKFDFTLFSYAMKSVAGDREAWPQMLRDRVVDIVDMDDLAAAALIDSMGIDILVDLKGHTLAARLHIVNLSSAPVKVTYLGYPGSVTGVDLDYVVSDPVVTPDSAAPHYHEKFCRLPETYQANGCLRRQRPAPASRADHGLPEDAFVFAAFNNNFKIMPRRLRLWAKIMAAVPGSLIWVMAEAPDVEANLRAAFAAEGIDPQRIIIAPRVSYRDNLSRARLADLALDTAPYNGHTTTSDMLWAGLPVVADIGNSFAARVSASLLRALDLPELVAASEEDLFHLAVSLANDPGRLAEIRARIETNRFRAPLYDAERFIRHLERGFEMMAERARQGLAPDHLDVPALPRRQQPFFVDDSPPVP